MNRTPVRVRLSAQKNWKNISIRYVLFLFIDGIESGKENKNDLPDWGKENKKGCLSIFNMEDNLFT